MVLLSAQGMDPAAIARVAFTSEDRVRDMIRNFNADGFNSLYPRYKGGRQPKFTAARRREIKKIAKARPGDRSHHPAGVSWFHLRRERMLACSLRCWLC
jgi:transposase